jgi:hypothetical protein
MVSGSRFTSHALASSADPGSRTSSLPVEIFRVSSLSRLNAI